MKRSTMRAVWCILALLLTYVQLAMCQDFYQLLGLNRQASTRDIRQAFKKLALTLHPDKNRDDTEAHDKFLKINRAYEVLKDDELRKKYDMHGEDGLKEGGPTGNTYQSWNFYNQNFGIYDDDAEIVTLSRTDFELSVEGTDDVWFINFYSPRCSHCHTIAPTWREVARELAGVVRIGAVNCDDDWQLCHQKVHSYPSLIIFPQNEKYSGEKSRDELVEFAMSRIHASLIQLNSLNYASHLEAVTSPLPWLIDLCCQYADTTDCLQHLALTKLAAMLDELVNVAVLHCDEPDCSHINLDCGVNFYKPLLVRKTLGQRVVSLDAREIAFFALEQLPDVTGLDNDMLQSVVQRNKALMDDERSWLIEFVDTDVRDLDLRKLPVLVNELNVGRVDCRVMRTACNNLHIHKLPMFAVFKPGKGHEIHHGRHTAHDIAAFARESSQNAVRVLGPQDFPRVINSQRPWFIDFFAPWCPPCMRLLPEFRKASKQFGHAVKFGTVDCTVHTTLCRSYNVHSYPTTILYNMTTSHQFHGQHHSTAIADFIQEILNPSVVTLTGDSFVALVGDKSQDALWLVDFYTPWCGPCQQLAAEWRQLAKMLREKTFVKVAVLNCDEHKSVCERESVRSYPTIRLYPVRHTSTKVFHTYSNWLRNAATLHAWITEFLPTNVTKLDSQSFGSQVLNSRTPWIVEFFAPWCGHCQVFAPVYEHVAESMFGRVQAGKMNCELNQQFCRQAQVRGYPSVRFYTGSEKNAYEGQDISSQDANDIIEFLTQRVPKVRKKDEL